MNFFSMEYFIVLAQERSFTKAAERLHITQQSLSSHIAGLEKELGCQLIIRHIPLELTYAGKVFLNYAVDFQKTQMSLQREFNDISQNQKGILRVGVASTRGRSLLPGTIVQFQKNYPNICIELTEGANDVLCQMLLKGTIDLAIADFPESVPNIQLKDFYNEETVLLIDRNLFNKTYGEKSEDYKNQFLSNDFKALKDCPFVIGSMQDIDGRIGYEMFKLAGIEKPIIRATSHNVGMLLTLCIYGIGACFCPENLAKSMLTKDQFVDLLMFRLGDKSKYPIRFGYQKQSYEWSIIEKFMECAKDNLNSIIGK